MEIEKILYGVNVVLDQAVDMIEEDDREKIGASVILAMTAFVNALRMGVPPDEREKLMASTILVLSKVQKFVQRADGVGKVIDEILKEKEL